MNNHTPGSSGIFIATDRALAIAEVDYLDLLNRYVVRRWYLYLIGVATAVTAMFFYLKTKQEHYAITARIVIQEKDKTNASDDLLRRSTELFSASQNVYNEMERLTSYELMVSVVEALDLQYGYWTERGLERIPGYRNFPVQLDSFAAPNEASADLSLRLEPQGDATFRLYEEDKFIGTFPFDSVCHTELGTFRFRRNGALPGGGDTPLYVSIGDPHLVAADYLEELTAEFTGINSTTIQLSIEDAVPARGVAILTELMRTYNETKRADAEQAALQALNFIDDRLARADQELQRMETNLEAYKRDNEIAGESTSDLSLVLRNVDEFGKQKEDLTLQLSALRVLETGLAATQGAPQLIALDNSVLTVGQLPDQVQLYNQLVLERKELLITGQPDNPAVVSITQRIASLRRAIEDSVASLRKNLTERQTLTQAQYDRAIAQLRSVPSKQRQVQDRSREQKIVEELYVYLLQKKEETALTFVNNATTAQIIDPPHAGPYPVSPNKKLYYFLALLCGGAVPFLYSMTREEVLNHRVETIQDLQQLFPQYELMGTISTVRGKHRLPVAETTRSVVSDQFRSLRNNLTHRFADSKTVFLITSAGKGEGKSFITVNLALSFARAHRRVVVVDFDFYHPQVANYLEQIRTTGLSDYLSGQAGLDEIVHPADGAPGLHYLPAGMYTGEQPGDLILNEARLTALFDHLRQRYDVILLDVPPIGMLTDAVLLNRFVTGSLYVVRAGVTTKASLKQGRKIAEAGRLKDPVLVLNAADADRQGYYH